MKFTTFLLTAVVNSKLVLSQPSFPSYSQQCTDDAGPPFADDEPGTLYHDGSAAFPVLKNGNCATPIASACSSRGNAKTAYLEGPIQCNGNGWYCRMLVDENWPPQNLISDLNFGYCNLTDAIEDPGYDRSGHCHGSDDDSTYYWWLRDHWFRGYNGRVRCCCNWNEGPDALTAGRIVNRCDFRRLVTPTEDVNQCRDANEDHGKGYEGGCDPSFSTFQLNQEIPEDDDRCWEIQRFGFVDSGGDDEDDEDEDDEDDEGDEDEDEDEDDEDDEGDEDEDEDEDEDDEDEDEGDEDEDEDEEDDESGEDEDEDDEDEDGESDEDEDDEDEGDEDEDDEDDEDDESGEDEDEDGESDEDEDNEDDEDEDGESDEDEDNEDDEDEDDEDEDDEGDEDEDESDEDEEEDATNDPDFRYKNVQFKNCDWVAKRPRVRCARKWKGTPVSDYCPASCISRSSFFA